jgi:hypothetical protein
MSRLAFYRVALAVPLVVPALVWGVLRLIESPAGGPVTVVAVFLVFSGTIAGAPYGVFALATGVWIGRLTEAELGKFPIAMPLLFLPVFIAWLLLQSVLVGEGFQLWGFLEGCLNLGMFVLLFGYGYVGLVELVRSIIDDRIGFRSANRAA